MKASEYNYDVLSKVGIHDHAATQETVDAKTALTKMKDLALSSQLATRTVIGQCLTYLDDNARSQLPKPTTISRQVRKWRQKAEMAPPVPEMRVGFEIPPSYGTIQNGAQFLAYDSGSEDLERVLIFCTDTAKDDLKRYSKWAVDVPGRSRYPPTSFISCLRSTSKLQTSAFPGSLPFYQTKNKRLIKSSSRLSTPLEQGSLLNLCCQTLNWPAFKPSKRSFQMYQ